MNQRATKAHEGYLAAAHAMQTGAAVELEHGGGEECNPKHLRVGVNSAMVEHAALAKLLIGKGVIHEDEYMEALEQMMMVEVKSYEERLWERGYLPQGVKLG